MGITRSPERRLAEAVPFFRRALEIEPSSAKAHQQIGLAYANLNQDNAAVAELGRPLQLAPNDAGTRANLGLVLIRQRKIPEATAQLEEACASIPTTPKRTTTSASSSSPRATPARVSRISRPRCV